MSEWIELSKAEFTEFSRRLYAKNKFMQSRKNLVNSYYFGCPEFQSKWVDMSRQLNSLVLRALTTIGSKDGFVYVVEPWHSSYKFELPGKLNEWKYDVIGGKADSVYFVNSTASQGSFYDFETSTFSVFGDQMVKLVEASQNIGLKYLYQKNGSKLLSRKNVPHLARHKHLFS